MRRRLLVFSLAAIVSVRGGDLLMRDECATMHRGAGDYWRDEHQIVLRTIAYPN